jgi:uncharacterized membrane protein
MPAPKLTDREPRRTGVSLALNTAEVEALDRLVEARRASTGRWTTRSMVLREAVLAVLRLDDPNTNP